MLAQDNPESSTVQDANALALAPRGEKAGFEPKTLSIPEPTAALRVRIDGKFFAIGEKRFWVKGSTYGAFEPDETGEEYHDAEKIGRDFAAMAAHGMNTVRIPHTVPPRMLLDIAQEHGLRVMVGLGAEQYVGYLIDRDKSPDIPALMRDKIRPIAGHPALLGYALGNEISAGLARWIGRRPIERLLQKIYRVVKEEDPEGLVTYVNYPTTEYLSLPFLDFVSFNVYLESPDRLAAYLSRLHNLAGDRPLLMSEIGLDAMRNGEHLQAESLQWQIRTSFEYGCAGTFIFSWTDEWCRAGEQVDDWAFGLTTIKREPKLALQAVNEVFLDTPFAAAKEWPRISVVLCTHNGAETLRESLEGLMRLEYPDYEVILVNDGSSDKTADIAAELGIRTITTPNKGLSHARNLGWQAATGTIVAYIDDDAWPDPHWLHFLAIAFERADYAGVGGPNIPPDSDGPIARCVANAPGGPTHVLLTDEIAEHIPGCNMAFRREMLERIGGFDPRFRSAGDDVDLCWRIQEAGGILGFSPAAVVWHRRRTSINRYLRQQQGYGKAEALLESKWPNRYNCVGHTAFHGRIYDWGAAQASVLGGNSRIYHGTWGCAPFQGLYEGQSGRFSSIWLMPEFFLITVLLGFLSVLGLSWTPLAFAAPLFLGAIALTATRAARAGSLARLRPHGKGKWESFRLRALTAVLHILQPIARLKGRIGHGLVFWNCRAGRTLISPRDQVSSIWSEEGKPLEQWLEGLEEELGRRKMAVRRGGDFDAWDLEVRGGLMAGARVCVAAEDHGAGRQYLRVRISPRLASPAVGGLALFAGLGLLAAFAQAWIATAGLAGLAVLTTAVLLPQWGAAADATSQALKQIAGANKIA